MVRPIEADQVTLAARHLRGRRVYLHMEVAPGGFMRNLRAELEEVVLRSDGATYRLALRCTGSGWVVMEGLTHMVIEAGQPLLLCTVADEDRITRVIQISKEAFPA